MKYYIYPLALALTSLAATSCSDTDALDTPQIPDDQKEMISFSMSDNSGVSSPSRAVTRAGFTGAETRIVARFQSDEDGGSGVRYTRTVLKAAKDNTGGTDDYSRVTYYTTDNTRYWDDAFGRKGQISVYAVAIPNSTDDTKLTDAKLAGGSTWATEATPVNTIDWDVTYTTTQTSATLAGEDLAYSNNIQDGGVNGRYVWDYEKTPEPGYPELNGRLDGHSNGRLVFTQKGGAQASDAGHFDKGHLMFKHSLSRLTVVLVPGTGFATDRSAATDFKFNKIEGDITSGNIQLLNFPVHGKLDLDAGSWTIDGTDGTKNILQMIGAAATSSASASAAQYNATAETYLANRTYSAQMLPGKVFGANSAANVMQFVIDDNTYYITEKMVYDALTTGSWYTSATDADKTAAGYNVGTSVTMTQGHNYTLTITVNKTGIANVTATLAPWVEVAGEHEVNNAHITLSLKTTGETCTKDIDLYRLIDNNESYDQNQYVFNYEGKRWYGDYTTGTDSKVTLKQTAYNASFNPQGVQTDDLSNKFWSTPWYFESNKEYYHFRTVNSGTTIQGNNDSTNDYFNIAAGPVADTDPHWGAPMKSTSTTWLKYDENGTLTDYSDDKGYEAHLHHAIGSTESKVAIQELHMMSNINVVLKTPDNGGKIQLRKPEVTYTSEEIVIISETTYVKSSVQYDSEHGTYSLYGDSNPEHDIQKAVGDVKEDAVETIVKITRIAANGTVEMGRGVVKPTGAYTGELTMTNPTTYFATDGLVTNNYTYAVVPQSLSRNFSSTSDEDYVGIFIQTPDHNQYYVVKKLSEILASSVSDQRDQTKDQPIKRWYPGHTYTYTFTITKKAIENITATVADWVTVTGKDTNITLED